MRVVTPAVVAFYTATLAWLVWIVTGHILAVALLVAVSLLSYANGYEARRERDRWKGP